MHNYLGNVMPDISIILPIFNAKNVNLIECVNSIKNKTMRKWECIIILESTSPYNAELLNAVVQSDHRFSILRPEKRIGLSASLNLGIESAKAPFIARIDSDDIMMPDRLEIQFNYLKSNSEISVVGSWCIIIDSHGKPLKIRKYPFGGILLKLYFHYRCGLAHPAVMFRKHDVLNVGGYNAKLKFCEDLDLWLRFIGKGYNIQNIQEPLIYYRKASRPKAHWIAMLKVRQKYLKKWLYR
jgi:glycosyltransferase involved in cell wall biosynthesis